MASPERVQNVNGMNWTNSDAFAEPEPTPFDSDEAPTAAPTEPETMVDCIRRFIHVQARRKEIAAEDKVLGAEERELSERVIEMMIAEGMDSPPGVDGMTAYISPVHYVKKNIDPETGEEFTPEDIRDALRAAGLGVMLSESYHGGQLRSTLKEYADHGEIPDALAKVVTLDKRRELRVTPMASKKRSAAPR